MDCIKYILVYNIATILVCSRIPPLSGVGQCAHELLSGYPLILDVKTRWNAA